MSEPVLEDDDALVETVATKRETVNGNSFQLVYVPRHNDSETGYGGENHGIIDELSYNPTMESPLSAGYRETTRPSVGTCDATCVRA